MNDWSRNLFGASIFFGAGMMMLAGRLSEWWTAVSLILMFAAAAVFLIRSVVAYRQTLTAVGANDEHDDPSRSDP